MDARSRCTAPAHRGWPLQLGIDRSAGSLRLRAVRGGDQCRPVQPGVRRLCRHRRINVRTSNLRGMWRGSGPGEMRGKVPHSAVFTLHMLFYERRLLTSLIPPILSPPPCRTSPTAETLGYPQTTPKAREQKTREKGGGCSRKHHRSLSSVFPKWIAHTVVDVAHTVVDVAHTVVDVSAPSSPTRSLCLATFAAPPPFAP